MQHRVGDLRGLRVAAAQDGDRRGRRDAIVVGAELVGDLVGERLISICSIASIARCASRDDGESSAWRSVADETSRKRSWSSLPRSAT